MMRKFQLWNFQKIKELRETETLFAQKHNEKHLND